METCKHVCCELLIQFIILTHLKLLVNFCNNKRMLGKATQPIIFTNSYKTSKNYKIRL